MKEGTMTRMKAALVQLGLYELKTSAGWNFLESAGASV